MKCYFDYKYTNYFLMISIKTEKVIITSLVNAFFFGSLMKMYYFCPLNPQNKERYGYTGTD